MATMALVPTAVRTGWSRGRAARCRPFHRRWSIQHRRRDAFKGTQVAV